MSQLEGGLQLARGGARGKLPASSLHLHARTHTKRCPLDASLPSASLSTLPAITSPLLIAPSPHARRYRRRYHPLSSIGGRRAPVVTLHALLSFQRPVWPLTALS